MYILYMYSITKSIKYLILADLLFHPDILLLMEKTNPQIVETQMGYKYFIWGVHKYILFDTGRICIRPNEVQKKPSKWLTYSNLGLATIAFNKYFKECLEEHESVLLQEGEVSEGTETVPN